MFCGEELLKSQCCNKTNCLELLMLTDSNKDDVTTSSVNQLVLIFARTDAPKPIEESCRLFKQLKLWYEFCMCKHH